MATAYAYKAIDARGEVQTGSLDGDDPDLIAERIRRMGLRPVSVTRVRGQALRTEIRIPGLGRGKRADQIAVFSRQFSTMIGAGLPILRCLEVLSRQCDDAAFAGVVAEVRADVENGDQLSTALSRQPTWFDGFYVSMVRAGESSGALPDVLERLAIAAEGISRLRRKIRSALAYPTVVACIIGATVAAMLLFLIPTFEDIFNGLGGDLPLPTQVVMGASRTLTGNFPVVALVVGLGIWAFRRWRRSDTGRVRWDGMRLAMPLFGKLARLGSLARFSSSLAVLAETGVPFVEALEVASHTAGNLVVQSAVGRVAATVSNGGSIASAMAEESVFTELVVQMVGAGEDSGAVTEMLRKIAEMYELEVETTVDGLTSLLEPLLIVVMAVTVGGMLLAVYLPMFKAISLVK